MRSGRVLCGCGVWLLQMGECQLRAVGSAAVLGSRHGAGAVPGSRHGAGAARNKRCSGDGSPTHMGLRGALQCVTNARWVTPFGHLSSLGPSANVGASNEAIRHRTRVKILRSRETSQGCEDTERVSWFRFWLLFDQPQVPCDLTGFVPVQP